MKRLVAVVGPTAAGKSALAIEMARRFDGETVNADSRLLYRGFDIGTAKPSRDERVGVPHHLVDILGPQDSYSLAVFLDDARLLVEEIASRGRLPILVGGTGQYVWGLLEGWDVPRVGPDAELRQSLEEILENEGLDSLVAQLIELEPAAAESIDLRNPRRVMRAIERARAGQPGTGGLLSPGNPPYDALVVGLTDERQSLYERVDERIDRMVQQGWAGEVKGLMAAGVGDDAPGMSAIGYRDMARHVRGEITLDELKASVRKATRTLVRRQYNWFKLTDPRIAWFEAGPDAVSRACELTAGWLQMDNLPRIGVGGHLAAVP